MQWLLKVPEAFSVGNGMLPLANVIKSPILKVWSMDHLQSDPWDVC